MERQKTPKQIVAYCVSWDETEYEPGWGMSMRPDGYTFALDITVLRAHLQKRADGRLGPSADGYYCYSTPGNVLVVAIPETLREEIKKSKTGVVWKNDLGPEVKKL